MTFRIRSQYRQLSILLGATPDPHHMLQSYIVLASASGGDKKYAWFKFQPSTSDSDRFDYKSFEASSVSTSPTFQCQAPSFALYSLKEFTQSSEQIHTRALEAARDGGRKKGRQQGMNGWIDGESEGRWRQREEREKC